MTPVTSGAGFTEEMQGGTRVLHFTGNLTLARVGHLPARLDELNGERLVLDLS